MAPTITCVRVASDVNADDVRGSDLDAHGTDPTGRLGDEVPVIDIGDLADGVGVNGDRSIREIADAARTWGFFQVVNHGIADDLMGQARLQMGRFFALPIDTKEKILRSRDNPWGYYNNELTKNQRDKKEVFDFTSDGKDGIYDAANRWPDFDPEFRSVMESYRDACVRLSLRLLEAFCHGLDLVPDFLNRSFHPDHTGFIRLNYYPTKDPLQDRGDVKSLGDADLGVHHHTDAGALTVLLQDDVGGLQVYHDDCWHDIRPVEGAFVINTGDMMQVWSNDIYHAAIHRVLAMSEKDRYSIPFFFNPGAGTQVTPLPSVVTDEVPAHYRTIDWSDYRGKRTDGDYADYGVEVQISQYKIQGKICK